MIAGAAALGWWFFAGPGADTTTSGLRPVPTPVTVDVELFVDPPSDVTVDTRALGKVQSSQLELTVGKHTFTQKIAGYREEAREIEVTKAGQTVTLHLPPFGIISVLNDFNVAIQGAKVYLDGKLLGFWGEGGTQAEQFSGCCNPTNIALRAADVGAASSVTRVVRPQ